MPGAWASIPPSRALAHAESGGRMVGNGSSSAFGVYQLLDGTAKDMGVDSHDLEGNVRGGLAYYHKAMDAVGGDKMAAIAAYHDGLNSAGANWQKGHPGDDSRFSLAARMEARQVGSFADAERADLPGGSDVLASTMSRLRLNTAGLSAANLGAPPAGNMHVETHVTVHGPSGTKATATSRARGDGVDAASPKVANSSAGTDYARGY